MPARLCTIVEPVAPRKMTANAPNTSHPPRNMIMPLARVWRVRIPIPVPTARRINVIQHKVVIIVEQVKGIVHVESLRTNGHGVAHTVIGVWGQV